LFSDSSMPLRHIGTIVIWEGNYNPDIKSIGYGGVFHELYFEEFYHETATKYVKKNAIFNPYKGNTFQTVL